MKTFSRNYESACKTCICAVKSEIYKIDIALLEQYIVVMNNATWITTDVNTCRRVLFANEASEENIFPTSAAPRQHILQAFYKQQNVIDVLRNKELN